MHVKTAKIYAFCAVCERRRLICHYQEGCDECENLRCLRMLHLSPSGVKIFEPSMLSANVASVAVAPVVLAELTTSVECGKLLNVLDRV